MESTYTSYPDQSGRGANQSVGGIYINTYPLPKIPAGAILDYVKLTFNVYRTNGHSNGTLYLELDGDENRRIPVSVPRETDVTGDIDLTSYVSVDSNGNLSPVGFSYINLHGNHTTGLFINSTWTTSNIKITAYYTIPVSVRDINFDNMFSFCSWATSSAKGEGTGSGTVSANLAGGIVTVKGHGDFYTTMTPHYTVPVEQGKEYVFRYDVTLNGSSQVGNLIQAFVFFVDNNGAFVTDQATGLFFKHSYTGEHLYFVPPSGCTKVSFRVGVANSSVDVEAVYSNMALYKTSWLTNGLANRQYRKAFESGSVVGLLYKPERQGYVFQGWYTGENGTGTHIRKINTLSANTTVYSHWKKRDYYDVNYDNLFSFSDWAYSPSGAVNGLSDSAYIGTITTDIPNGTVTVKGADPNGSAFYTMYGSFSPYHHIPVVAGKQYAFRYTVSQTYNMQVFVFFCNDNQDFVTDPSTGLQFVYDVNGNDLVFTPPSGCTNVCFRLGVGGINTAVYSNIGLYDTSVEQGVTNRQVRKNIAIGSTVGTLSTPSKEGYTFKGWYTGESGSGAEIKSSDSFIKGVTAYSAWTKLHTVTFKDENGTTLKTEAVAEGSTITPPSNPTKADTAQWDYTFDGWYDATDTKWTSDTVITSDTVFTAQFTETVRKYTITASGENGTVTGGGTYEYGKTVTLTATPDDGYQFVKWSDGVTTATRTVTVTGAAAYTAVYELIPPEIKSVQMIYLDKQISVTNKVPCGEGFIISVELS